jgi:hypothetical protein
MNAPAPFTRNVNHEYVVGIKMSAKASCQTQAAAQHAIRIVHDTMSANFVTLYILLYFTP